MRTLYLDCGMGAAGDMLMAALLELCPEKKEAFLARMNALGLPGVTVEAEPSVKCGITGTHMKVTVFGDEEESADVKDGISFSENAGIHGHGHVHEESGHEHGHAHSYEECGHTHEEPGHEHGHAHSHEECGHTHEESGHEHGHHHGHGHSHGGAGRHHHADMAGISHIISHLDLPEAVRENMTAVYALIAEAEAHAHGKPVDEIHFHEVGTADAIADIAGVCLLMYELSVEQVFASPVHVGSGHVHCAHGILPVPAPATAHILQGVPVYSTEVRGELCTPTGAALLKRFVKEFREMPVMTLQRTGYGMGKKEFERANCVRAMLGETAESGSEIIELSCNLDDMTPELIGFAQEALFQAGALEVYTVPAGMKKSRPGTLLTCMCRLEDREAMVGLLFRHTTTLGIREHVTRRYTLKRKVTEIPTPYGPVRQKLSEGYGVRRCKLEYEDLARIAREQGMSIEEVRNAAAETLPGLCSSGKNG